MLFLDVFVDPNSSGNLKKTERAFVDYIEYMKSNNRRLPLEAFEFVVNDWHYNSRHHRSLHDSWLNEFSLTEKEGSQGKQDRSICLTIELLGPFHDGSTTVTYADVSNYRIDLIGKSSKGNRAHGDLLIDELTVGTNARIIHEIVFSSGALFHIESSGISYSTTIPDLCE